MGCVLCKLDSDGRTVYDGAYVILDTTSGHVSQQIVIKEDLERELKEMGREEKYDEFLEFLEDEGYFS